ncbi:unnamed protein product [Timema podura]|uniref:Uncharacterized protein n=1 Tax=Timema podura TaxID=61482 RepID=A0ABN7PEN7_TIMPD|nr:unnamed protein product [Timema podura]
MNEDLRNPRSPAGDKDVVGSRDMPVICQMWKAHSTGISDLDVCESHKIIATGSTDGSVRIWTYEGRYIGMLGQPKEWNIINPKTFMHPKLPRDVLTDLDDAFDAGLDPTESSMEEVLSKSEHLGEEGSQSVQIYSDEQIAELVKDYEVFEMVLPPYLRYEGRNKIVYKNSLGPHKYSLAPVNTWRYRNENIF